MSHQLTERDIQVLELLANSFVAIRYVASRGLPTISDKERLEIINDLAEASHNLPTVIATGGENSQLSFLLNSNVTDLKEALKKVRY
jgi:hypothetical protein